MTSQQIVDELNQQFALRQDNRLASARINMQSWATYSKQALGEVLAGSSGGMENLSADNKQIYQELYDIASSVLASFGADTKIVDIQPDITANIDNFFKNPADGSKIQSDPFVLDGHRIEAVEAYWQQMLSSACDFRIGTHAKVFSSAVHAIQGPYYKLFNAIKGHRFGKWQA
ncbi:MAG: hypothetical protein V2A66_05850 [Pseudomonadota bacterium]